MARRKVRARDLKKQRWAGIVAAVLALGMILGLFGPNVYHAIFGGGTTIPDQQVEPEPQDYLDYYEGEVERLESHLEENEASEAVLLELAENYRYLTVVQQVFFNDEDSIAEYQERLITIFASLADLEPSNPQYRLELAYLYLENRDDNRQLLEETTIIKEILRSDPDPMFHLSLVQLLDMAGEEELVEEESLWLEEYLGERITAGPADNEERFYYAVLVGEYQGETDLAQEILADIVEQESEESRVYQNAISYIEYFRSDRDDQDISIE